MSAYDNDARVTDVTGHGALFRVALQPGEEPVARVRRFLEGDTFVVWMEDEEAKTDWQEFPTADEAIASLIGAPQ